MTYLVLGLIIFLGLHSTRIVAADWRSHMIERWGLVLWKRVYAAISLLSFALIVWGFAQARLQARTVWVGPTWSHAATALLMLVSMVMLMGFHFKRSHISVALRHPMLWSVVVLSAGHLLSNGAMHHILLFGGFGLWSVADLASCYRRDQAQGTVYPRPRWTVTLINVASGVLLWLVAARYLHIWLIGVSPMAQ